MEKVVGVGTYTEYAYDAGGQVIGTHDRSSWPQEVVPHSALPTPLAKYQDAGTYFVHPNLLRSSTKLTDHSGTGSDELFFHAWGEKWFPESGTLKDYRFASMTIRDDETTLDPTLYRNYSSRLGRWLTPDPASCGAGNPQNLNRYPYGANNPANRIDPTGLQPLGGWICFISPWDDPCSDFIFYAFHPVECFAYQGLGFYNPWSGFPPVPSPPRWLCIWIDVGMGGGSGGDIEPACNTNPDWAKDCDKKTRDDCLKCCKREEATRITECTALLWVHIDPMPCINCVTRQVITCENNCPKPPNVPLPPPPRRPPPPPGKKPIGPGQW